MTSTVRVDARHPKEHRVRGRGIRCEASSCLCRPFVPCSPAIETTLQVGSTLATDPLATCAERQTCAVPSYFSFLLALDLFLRCMHACNKFLDRSRVVGVGCCLTDSTLRFQRIRSHQSTPRTSRMSQSDNPSGISKQRD